MVANYATAVDLSIPDCDTFDMKLLHFRRTFIEKLFAIHGYVQDWRETGNFADPMVRHYADLYLLSEREEVIDMLESDEADQIKRNYDEKSRKAKRKNYRPPEELNFKDSPALFPDEETSRFLEPKYVYQCDQLFNSRYPKFGVVLNRFKTLRPHL